MHGSHTDGDNLPPFYAPQLNNLGFFVLYPTTTVKDGYWGQTEEMINIFREIDWVARRYRLDFRRISLTGGSMGGCGTWSLLTARPELWNAGAPVAGYPVLNGFNFETLEAIRGTPFYMLHGEKDHSDGTRRLAAEFQRRRIDVTYVEAPGSGHTPPDKYWSDVCVWLAKQPAKPWSPRPLFLPAAPSRPLWQVYQDPLRLRDDSDATLALIRAGKLAQARQALRAPVAPAMPGMQVYLLRALASVPGLLDPYPFGLQPKDFAADRGWTDASETAALKDLGSALRAKTGENGAPQMVEAELRLLVAKIWAKRFGSLADAGGVAWVTPYNNYVREIRACMALQTWPPEAVKLVQATQDRIPRRTDAAPVRTNGFLDDFAAAQKEAAARKRPLFVLFTGSDWCSLCMKLRSEISDAKVFKEFAADHLVLFEADFPKGKKQTAAVKRQNEELANKYGVSFYPTVLLLDATGKVLGQTGYQEGGADAYVKHLKELLEKAGVKVTDAAKTSRSDPPTARPPAGAARELALNLGNAVALKLAPIPKGTFLMGSPATENDPEHGHANNEVQHEVTISKPFYMGVTEVTQKQYETVMGKNPSTFKGPNNPVDQVTWDEAVEFCRKLSATTGKTIRLPTEAEWEYACRAGSKARFSFGGTDAELGAYAWYTANSMDRTKGMKTTHPVGQKKPNAWGLFDMHGNVWEWCSDWYAADYGPGSKTDPAGPAKGDFRVLRGGSWNYCSWGCRLAGRGRIGPDGHYDVSGGGFRVVVTAGKD